MILVSNHVLSYIDMPVNAVIRINMAWIEDMNKLKCILNIIEHRKVYLDYPYNRSKFPKSVLTFEDAYQICNEYPQIIKYFAVSNIETVDVAKRIQSKIPITTEFVPKIETLEGVKNLGDLIYQCNLKTIMLDKEDLLVDVNKNNDEFFKCVEHVRGICKGLRVELLELQGVVFIGA